MTGRREPTLPELAATRDRRHRLTLYTAGAGFALAIACPAVTHRFGIWAGLTLLGAVVLLAGIQIWAAVTSTRARRAIYERHPR